MDNKNESIREELLTIMPERIVLETSIGAFQYKINELIGRYLELGFTAEDIINIAESVKDEYLNKVSLDSLLYPGLQELIDDQAGLKGTEFLTENEVIALKENNDK